MFININAPDSASYARLMLG